MQRNPRARQSDIRVMLFQALPDAAVLENGQGQERHKLPRKNTSGAERNGEYLHHNNPRNTG